MRMFFNVEIGLVGDFLSSASSSVLTFHATNALACAGEVVIIFLLLDKDKLVESASADLQLEVELS